MDENGQHLAIVLRYPTHEGHLEPNDPVMVIEDAIEYLKNNEYMFWEFQTFVKGYRIKDYPHHAIPKGIVDKIFFMNAKTRMVTHASDFQYLQRRDLYFSAPKEQLLPLIHPKFKKTWFDPADAARTFTALIFNLQEIQPRPIESFWVYRSHGTVNPKDELVHARVVVIPEDMLEELKLSKRKEKSDSQSARNTNEYQANM